MKVPSRIYLFKDSHGNTASNCCEEGADTIQICGMKDKDGEPLYFESEAYHADSFCVDNNIEMRMIEREEDFDTLWKNAK